MGVFAYKDYSGQEAADLASLSFQLASWSGTRIAFGLPAGDIVEWLDRLVGPGRATGSPIDTSLPAGWSEIGTTELGLDPSWRDADGFIRLISPLTGQTLGGPQLKVVAERDDSGALTRIGIAYVGTNSLVDLPDYSLLNSGAELAAAMEPVLQAIAAYARANGLDGSDVVVTGYSLGAGMTNIQARFADTLADGFFADSDYIGHAAPVIHDDPDRVLNIGFENDVIHRIVGDQPDFLSGIAAMDPFLSNNDKNFATSTDNMVIFDGVYNASALTLAIHSFLNPFGWWGHLGAMVSDSITRIGAAPFYEFTSRDSVIVVSNLGADLRGSVWVHDKPSPTSDHYGAPSFVIGTQYGDRLRDGPGNDWIYGGAGDDLIRVSSGLNRVDGGAGFDTLRVIANHDAVTVSRLSDGTLVFDDGRNLHLASNIEKVEIGQPGLFGLTDNTRPYSIMGDRLRDDGFSLFGIGKRDIRYTPTTQGDDADDLLTGSRVFGQGGDDRLTGTNGRDLLHGGEGDDWLFGGAGNDRLYGAEGNDTLVAGTGTDRLNGGHGDDVFVFDASLRGTAIVEDFNKAADEADMLMLIGGNAHTTLASAYQRGADLHMKHGQMNIVLEGVRLGDLSEDWFM